MNQQAMIRKLKIHLIDNFKNDAAAADAWGVSRAYLSAVKCGVKDPSDKILQPLGLIKEQVKTVSYKAAGA